MVTQTLTCYHCGSPDLIRFGHQNNRQCYRCKGCGKTSRENKGSNAYDPVRKAEILVAYHERGSLRAMTRIFGVSRNTVLAWLKKAASLPSLRKTLVKARKGDVLELDELWSFVQHKKNKRWVWLAQCRRTRQIVACAIGDRSRKTCALLWERVPKSYKKAMLYTDFWVRCTPLYVLRCIMIGEQNVVVQQKVTWRTFWIKILELDAHKTAARKEKVESDHSELPSAADGAADLTMTDREKGSRKKSC